MLQKRKKCLTDKEIAAIAVRVFNGERRGHIAKQLGVSASYLSRLLKDAQRRKVFYYVIAEE